MNTKTAVITGASRGIGKAIATVFAQNNYNVIINYNKNETAAYELKNALTSNGYECDVFKADVGNYDECSALMEFCIKKYGRIDTLVNNAGISQIKLFTDIQPDEWDAMIKTNLTGIFNCSQCALKYMLKEHSGNIINISSMWGVDGASCEVHYSAAKAGVIGFTKALAKEVGLSNIRVNCIAPGVIMTDMMNGFSEDELCEIKNDIPLNTFGTPEDVANAALFLASDNARFITGQTLGVNGGQVM
ncbi:MAG: 3-oxoacyl-ACP reductase FabG [Clostridia bacterium]|nr:3-oxoacyl-ACP reductase FabG [Clostridia bacterium]